MSSRVNSKRKLPSAKRPAKRAQRQRRQRREVSDYDDSDNSLSEYQQGQDGQKALLPLPDTTTKLPEELLKTFYKTPGVLLIGGMVSWDLVAKRDNQKNRTHPNLYVFHKFTDKKYRFVASSCSAGHSVLIGENGEAYTFGRNTHGQLGMGDKITRDVPTIVPGLEGKNVIHAAVGKHHTLFVTDTGTVYACGNNKSGQCGIGTQLPHAVLTPSRIRHAGAPIVKVGCGAEFSMILDCNGALHSFGLPEYGQLGHNSDGKYFVTSNKISFYFVTTPKHVALFFEKTKQGNLIPVRDVEIVDFACGNNHTVAIDSQKRAYSWGFGGFGRLGHSETRNEAVPRLIKYFEAQCRGVYAVSCGSTFSLAVNETGGLYLFGQTKRTGEANMYPKPVQDLTGWNIKSIGSSNTSIVVAADDAVVSWGVSPTYGELGTGEINKSSANPREIPHMEGVTQVTMGYSHTLILCDDTSEAAREHLAAKPTFTP